MAREDVGALLKLFEAQAGVGAAACCRCVVTAPTSRLGAAGLELNLGLGHPSAGHEATDAARSGDGQAALEQGSAISTPRPSTASASPSSAPRRALQGDAARALRPRPKVGRLLRPQRRPPDIAPSPRGPAVRRGIRPSYDGTMRSLEDSLQRLGLPRSTSP
ncbi:MAG: hypothetical protein R3D25_04130 [Geminicoccaceae bacterium]